VSMAGRKATQVSVGWWARGAIPGQEEMQASMGKRGQRAHGARRDRVARLDHVATRERVARQDRVARPERVARPDRVARPELVARLANVESPDNGVIQGHRVRPANADQPDQKGTRASRAAKPDVPATAARRGHGERPVRRVKRVMPDVRVHLGCRGSQAERGV